MRELHDVVSLLKDIGVMESLRVFEWKFHRDADEVTPGEFMYRLRLYVDGRPVNHYFNYKLGGGDLSRALRAYSDRIANGLRYVDKTSDEVFSGERRHSNVVVHSV